MVKKVNPPVDKANQVVTGWPPGLLQDDCPKLTAWFTSKVDAKYYFKLMMADRHRMSQERKPND